MSASQTAPGESVRFTGAQHFGERLRASMFGHRMTRELYAYPSRSPHQRLTREDCGEQLWADIAWAYDDDEHNRHSDAYLLVQRDAALFNFDLSMQYFASLDPSEFEIGLQQVLATDLFKPVRSLPEWAGTRGAYVMVFDEYRQFYIGKADDIRLRIKQHWTKRKSFDRLIFGSKYDSIFPVDEFRALDTTRIYALASTNPYQLEQNAERAADPRFCLNRIPGGQATQLSLMFGLTNPRGRAQCFIASEISTEEQAQAIATIATAAEDAKASQRPVGPALADLDMSIHWVTRKDGSRFLWSIRDHVASMTARGELSAEDYTQFLTAMGETVLWPKN